MSRAGDGVTTAAAVHDALAARLAAAPRLLAFDVDGTLAPIVARPEDAAVPEGTRAALRRLAGAPQTHLAFVSGRGAADARAMVGLDGVWTIGNHGLERIDPEGEGSVAPGARRWLSAMIDAAAEATSLTSGIPGVQVEDKRWSLSVHWRNADPASAPRVQDLLAAVAARSGLRLTEGKRVFELRPPLEVDKGTALVALARDLFGDELPAGSSLLYAGDDTTDEDAFRALRAAHPGAVTLRVLGDREEDAVTATHAELALPGVAAMAEALGQLAERFT